MTRQISRPATASANTPADPLAEFPAEVRDAVAALPPLVMLKTVTEWSGYSVPGLYKYMSRGAFPRPLKLGPNRIAWTRLDLARWLADRLEVRSAAEAAARRTGDAMPSARRRARQIALKLGA